MKRIRIIYALLFLGIFLTEVIIALFINDNFIRPYFGDVLITLLLCCFFRLFLPKQTKALPIFVFLFSVVVEVLQYFDIVKLLGLDNIKFFSVLIGRTFSWVDILCYAIGCISFFFIDHLIFKHHNGS